MSGLRPEARLILLSLLGLAILGVLAILFATRNGIGLSTDSVVYIDSARRLVRGDGFTGGFTGHVGPITHWPPLYPSALAALALLGLDPLVGARILALLLFGANVFVVGWLVWRHGSGGILPALASSLLVLVSADLLEIHSWGWSEPLFLLLCALGLHHLALYLAHPHRRRRLIAAAAFVGLAALTRYLGVTVIMAGGLAILWLAPGRWLRRGVDALLFGVLSTVPLALWMLRNLLLSGTPTSRALVVNPIGLEQLLTAARTVSAWLVPPILPGSIRIVLLIAALAVMVVGVVRTPTVFLEVLQSPGSPLLKAILLFVTVYGAFLALFISLFDADVTFDARLLSPLHFLLLVGLGLVLAGAQRAGRWMWIAVCVVALLQTVHAAAWVRAAESGLGYAGRSWRESALWRVIEQLPEQTPLYSNAYDAVYIHTARPTRPLPSKFNPNSLVADDQYRERLASLRAELAQTGGVVIYSLPMGPWRPYMPTEAELEQGLAPFESRRFPDATLYQVSR
ncbi:hypothetical protein BH23GEM7_BH23GEM7_03580 [soil metagenome]